MLELVKIIVEAVLKSLSPEAVREAKREVKLNEIGTEMFLLYSHLNSIIILANEIVNELEHGLDWMKRKVSEGEAERELYTRVPFLLTQQGVSVSQFVISLKKLGCSLEVISPEAYHSLVPLIHGKCNAVAYLQEISLRGQGEHPRLISVSEESLQRFVQEDEELGEHPSRRRKRLMEIIVTEPFDDLARIPAQNYNLVENYLKTREPRVAINSLESAAKLMRKSIEENFSLKDILLNVGDRRGASTGWSIGF